MYTSTAPELRAIFIEAGRAARTTGAGVWATDTTGSFSISGPSPLGPAGALIWPKLFRRVTDYLRQRQPDQSLPDWLAATPLQDDDIYVGAAPSPVPLHTLTTQTEKRIHFTADLLDLTVVER